MKGNIRKKVAVTDKKIVPDNVPDKKKIDFLKKIRVTGAAAFISMSLAACAGGGKAGGVKTGAAAGQEKTENYGGETVNEQETSGTEAEEPKASTVAPQQEPESDALAPKEGAGEEAEGTKAEAGDTKELPRGNPGADMVNPVRQVDSPSDFEAIGLKLELPVNDQWYSEPLFTIIDGRVAQIQFIDEITGSDAIARAGKIEEDEISGIYYVFDDSRKQSWFTKLEDGTKVDITIQVAAENSDVHGVLATWAYKDIAYSLWEDDAWDAPDAVAKMAIEIMERSDPETE